MNRNLVSVACLALLLSAAGPAFAGDKMSAAQAKKEFAAAQALYQKNRCGEALPRFQHLVDATDSPNARLYLARCLRQLGKLPEAYEAMTQSMRAADARASTDEYYAETRNAAAAERAALESKVVRVVVALADTPDGLAVELNGSPLPSERLGETLAVAPGRVSVKATAPGRAPFERKLELKAGASITVAVALRPADEAPATTTPEPTGPSEKESKEPAETEKKSSGSGGFGLRGWGFVTIGVGVAGFATFAVAGLTANKRYDSLSSECNGPCPEGKRSDVEGGKTLDLVANIGLGIGVAGLAVGTTMVLLGGSRKEQPTQSVSILPLQNGGAVEYSRRF
jgi:hypothetical protein